MSGDSAVWTPECPVCHGSFEPSANPGCELCATWQGWYPTNRAPLDRVMELAQQVYHRWARERMEWEAVAQASFQAAAWGLRRLELDPAHYTIVLEGPSQRIAVTSRDAVTLLGELT